MAQPLVGVTIRNWANVYAATPSEYFEPATIEEVAAIVKSCNQKNAANGPGSSVNKILRVVGAGHSPNDCAMSDSVMMSLKRLSKVHLIDITRAVVKVDAGITIKDLTEILDKNGLAIPNLGSISDQTIAGAIATGTHGTGATLGSLSSMVLELTLVDGQGNIITASPDDPSTADLFHAACVSFGALGVVVGLTLQVVRAFDLQTVENEVSLTEVLSNIDQRARSAKHYRFWWFPHTNTCNEWRGNPVEPLIHREGYTEEKGSAGLVRKLYRSRIQPLVDWFWGMLVGFHLLQLALWLGLYFPSIIPHVNELWRKMLFSPALSYVSYFSSFFSRANVGHTEDSSLTGVYKRRTDRSDRCFNFNCLFQQHVDEWAIPFENLPQALMALKQVIDSLGQKAHFPVEVRFVAEDKAWLSPCYGRPLSCYIGIIAYKPYGVESEYKRYFLAFEREMLKFGGRPHWAKDCHLKGDDDFAPLYPKWYAFKALRDKLDPNQVFVNPFVSRILLNGEGRSSNGAARVSPSPSSSSPFSFASSSPRNEAFSSGAGAMPQQQHRSTTTPQKGGDEEPALRRRNALNSPRE
jgi:L-gulonolactone oxidase